MTHLYTDLASATLSLLVVALPVAAFAALAFPLSTLLDSFRVALTGHARRADAAGMAVGVFAALGRAALLSGFNGAVVAFGIGLLIDGHGRVGVAAAALALGVALRLLIVWPLERAAFARLSA